ncbi:hypothetical protein J7I98_04205 [Streptomyces sp. ISL-98]|uniref:hypothetical protein n=1 Tax=Streptomyces sp. ISL-98 TaxID=2819192 RepID=UPI001BE65318|nr:hypothetical protein [Streptomyces sp. ISL-98]MBT2505110.1 hypothetical protein [Streptomyces sp. ISL-98]
MDLTAGTRATAISAAIVLVLGVAVILYGVAENDLARSLGGACLSMTALTLIALVAIKKWCTDTRVERASLTAATRAADAERTRYVALESALATERARTRRDIQAQQEAMAARLEAECVAMQERFEERRAQLICDTMEMTLQMKNAGLLDPPAAGEDRGRVIGFPAQHPQTQAERARDHGANH